MYTYGATGVDWPRVHSVWKCSCSQWYFQSILQPGNCISPFPLFLSTYGSLMNEPVCGGLYLLQSGSHWPSVLYIMQPLSCMPWNIQRASPGYSVQNICAANCSMGGPQSSIMCLTWTQIRTLDVPGYFLYIYCVFVFLVNSGCRVGG